MRSSKVRAALVFIAIGLVLFLVSNRVDELRVYQGAEVAVYVVAISAIVLLTGYSGQISLGHGALMAVGAYAAVLSRNYWHLPIPLTFVAAVLAAALFGAILGVAAGRLTGPYLAGTTLALAVGLPSLANEFGFLGGEQGLTYDVGLPPAWLGADFTQYKWFFWIAALSALLIVWLTYNILGSRYGRSWRASRSNPTSAALAGIHVGRSKVLAFTISSGLAGLAGALLAMTISLVTPSAFPLSLSFAIVTGAVLAGVTLLTGSIVGAIVLVAIPELTGSLAAHLGGSEKVTANLPGLMTSVLLILSVLFFPNGPKLNWRKVKKSSR
ncbi:MAG: branched-chain amino acid ABC transporter permease [Actinomycetes bacterium]|jgi:branched-chain amino acid transport system permease protein